MRLFILTLFTTVCQIIAQESIPSLQKWQDKSLADSTRILAGQDFIWDHLIFSYPDSAIPILDQQLELLNYPSNSILEGDVLITYGAVLEMKSDVLGAIDYYQKALNIFKPAKKKKKTFSALNNLGNALSAIGQTPKALEYYFTSLKIAEEIQDTGRIATALNNIGKLDYDSKNFKKALKSFKEALYYFIHINNEHNMASCYLNIGNVYANINQLDSALFYFNKNLITLEKTPNIIDLAYALRTIGMLYSEFEKHEIALDYLQKAEEKYKQANYSYGFAIIYESYAILYYRLKQYNKAQIYGEKALKIAKEIKDLVRIKTISFHLYHIYRELKNYKRSIELQDQYFILKDSLTNIDHQKNLTSQRLQFEYKQKMHFDSIQKAKLIELKNADILIQKSAKTKEEEQKYYALTGLLLSLLLSFGLLFLYRITRKQKVEIETKNEAYLEQKNRAEEQQIILAEKNREILESISHAKKIQNAILPPPKLVREWLNDSFIFYQPKDIIAGDFYWMETTKKNNRTIIFFAVADCTGYGVPGAMVSVVCSNAMNRAIKEFDIQEPGVLLDKVVELVKGSFSNSESDVQEGMDIGLCAIDLLERKVWYSGAKNPLYRTTHANLEFEEKAVFNEKSNRMLLEYKGSNQNISNAENIEPFTTTEITLEPGDCIYLFSDGYADQFGGNKGKKYKYSNFKNLLLEVESLEMESQKERLHSEFEKWKGDLEQIDDLCVIGLRVNGHVRKLFSKRELEIIERINEGKSSKIIADELFISKATVDTHRKRIFAKANINSATELIKFCREHHVV